jgi:ubiquitin-protein ligase
MDHHHSGYLATSPHSTTMVAIDAEHETPSTPKTDNSNKRKQRQQQQQRTTTTLDCFDCRELGLSLKRVRLSCSPGEIRLDRDIRHAINSNRFVELSENQWRVVFPDAAAEEEYTNGTSSLRVSETKDNHERMHLDDNGNTKEKSQDEWFLRRPPRKFHATIARTEGDPLELQIRMEPLLSTKPTTTLALSFPRLYPHHPPKVTRIMSEQATTQLRNYHKATWNLLDGDGWKSCDCGKVLPKIVIAESPEDAAYHAKNTIVLKDWSPVCRLVDICDMIIESVASDGDLTPTRCNCARRNIFHEDGFVTSLRPALESQMDCDFDGL